MTMNRLAATSPAPFWRSIKNPQRRRIALLLSTLQEEDRALAEGIKEAETGIDYHTVENRTKRKAMQERRNKLAQDMKALGENMQCGQQSFAQIHQSVETNLALASHAKTWSWKEVEATHKSD